MWYFAGKRDYDLSEVDLRFRHWIKVEMELLDAAAWHVM